VEAAADMLAEAAALVVGTPDAVEVGSTPSERVEYPEPATRPDVTLSPTLLTMHNDSMEYPEPEPDPWQLRLQGIRSRGGGVARETATMSCSGCTVLLNVPRDTRDAVCPPFRCPECTAVNLYSAAPQTTDAPALSMPPPELDAPPAPLADQELEEALAASELGVAGGSDILFDALLQASALGKFSSVLSSYSVLFCLILLLRVAWLDQRADTARQRKTLPWRSLNPLRCAGAGERCEPRRLQRASGPPAQRAGGRAAAHAAARGSAAA
jgi:hypothetical protein